MKGERRRKTYTLALFLFTLLTSLFTLLPAVQADRSRSPYHAFIGGMTGTAQTADFYFAFTGHNASATYLDEAAIAPFSGMFKELRCRLPATNDSDESWTFSVYVNAASSRLSCTVGASAQTCSNLVDSVPVSAGDTFAGFADNTAGGSPSVLVRCTVVLYEYF